MREGDLLIASRAGYGPIPLRWYWGAPLVLGALRDWSLAASVAIGVACIP